jgi:hypothetical protein
MLNYLYAILESEARIAAVAVGLDPTLGMLHSDTDSRPSLACDLMEAVRTHVDEYVLNWITLQTLRREWFFEERDGNCRLMAGFAERLAEAAPGFASAVTPIAESVVKALTRKNGTTSIDTAASTKRRRPDSFLDRPGAKRDLPAAPRVCGRCGRPLRKGYALCRKCADADLAKSFPTVLAKARLTANSADAQTKRAETQRRNAEAVRQWTPEDLPDWLNAKTFARRVVPALRNLRTVDVARCLASSVSYAAQVRTGARTPHPRHWTTLATEAGLLDRPEQIQTDGLKLVRPADSLSDDA